DHAVSYGGDPWTKRAHEAIRHLLGMDCEVFLLFTGTAGNALALAHLAPPYGRVACHEAAHVLHDECSAPQFFGAGLALHPLPGAHGKIDPAALETFATSQHVHSGKAAAVTLTQATELGTVYSLVELRALREVARRHGLRVHMDGARFANAVATLRVSPREIIEAAGLDALTLGGTKNGMMGAEAVCFFNRDLAREFDYRRKQAGQLASKHRFLAAQWVGALESGAWLRHAENANAMAALLEAGLSKHGFTPVHPRGANEIFLKLPAPTVAALQARGWVLYDDPAWGGHRLVCSWDVTREDVEAFLGDLAALR
ncbi:MAG TPA: beta-eliminating lyase-related protein, partial [Candidatus Thermoplasmatota archaeon]|nr:beta-eliminating lyase-related protein [Candidatus Thermoplasmatota archaeon]